MVWLEQLSPRNILSIYQNEFELSLGVAYPLNFLEYNISIALFIKKKHTQKTKHIFIRERKVENQILEYCVSNDPKIAWYAGCQAVETLLTPPSCVVSPN